MHNKTFLGSETLPLPLLTFKLVDKGVIIFFKKTNAIYNFKQLLASLYNHVNHIKSNPIKCHDAWTRKAKLIISNFIFLSYSLCRSKHLLML